MTYHIAQETLLSTVYQTKWGKNLKKNRYMYMYN